MPRFVVLAHDHPSLHWDFMLEKEAVLRTWRLARPPGERGPIEAQPLSDHRLAYLNYEGPVSGNRGTVQRFDRGEYAAVTEADDRIEVELRGDVLRGKAVLERAATTGSWSFQLIPEQAQASGGNTM
jgi:hypothetical protein